MSTNQKYEFVPGDEIVIAPGRTLKRIRALVAIAALFVVPGDLGGYIETYANLSVHGDAWVSGNARVYGNARVSGDAQVYGDARVYGNAQVSGDAWVSGNAWVYGNAQVYGDADKTPIHIQGLQFWGVTIADEIMTIGCQSHTFGRWYNFTDDEIDVMDNKALEWWKTNKAAIFALIIATGRYTIPA